MLHFREVLASGCGRLVVARAELLKENEQGRTTRRCIACANAAEERLTENPQSCKITLL